MDSSKLTLVFEELTRLTKSQIKTLVRAILEYDESDELAYQVVGMLNSGTPIEEIIEDLNDNRLGWNSNVFSELRQTREFKDKMISEPPEIREGEMECPKCHLKKTIVVPMQTRSADEGFTYYIHCFNPNCKKITKT